MEKIFLKGNDAMAEAAIRAGCRFFAGYPITPQNEIPEYLSKRLPEVNGVFIQGESEIASISMVYGVASTGIRSMTSSSGPGLCLKTEGINFLVAAEIPAVIIDVMRAGPAIGGIQPAQQDYTFITGGAGPGGVRCFVLAPYTVQEAVDLVYEAFDIADKFRNPVIVMVDGAIGNMMENIILPELRELDTLPQHEDWKITKRDADGKARIIQTYIHSVIGLEEANKRMAEKYKIWEDYEQRYEAIMLEDAEIVVTAYGIVARMAKAAVKELRKEGIKVGMIRPIAIYPFPKKAFDSLDYGRVKQIWDIELSIPSQMFRDVDYTVRGRAPVYQLLRSGGMMTSKESIIKAIREKALEGENYE
ncbi:MAG TPA: 3-methyl-2-oxobutanoate dehydrogenase subunit VorB [Sedimentibacter sp.]|nr:3-methyl-2-oxobutanoate dehydrogenase subunit VorB [Sedimentibacter sp.]HOG63478.1 3-methyl-2-oxobutanoate dehydrogenase subunit VorB [Sedimentibacter sp.]HPX00495.1 3-methyl-2-oxobutanoate dehydrogenase subunit VorB [Sedimentibacter sp.]HQB63687.1 3-methyl-2-oxobutanoate dehydrogenase subunit VorB [Sedimentibacter sp.]